MGDDSEQRVLAMMQTSSQQYGIAYPHPDVGTRGANALEFPTVDRPPCFSRKCIEFLFYAITMNSWFMQQTGFGFEVRFSGGGPITVTGLIALLIFLSRGEPVPTILWFAAAMNLGANLSQFVGHGETPILGEALPAMVHFFCQLAILCYVVEDKAARKRVIIVLSFILFAVMQLGGVQIAEGTRRSRLDLGEVIAGSIGDANSLAYFAAILAVTILFWSLRASKAIRPLLWLLAGVLALVLVRTVSRGGMVAFAAGLMLLVIAALLGRGARLSGVVLIMIVLVGASILVSKAGESVEYLASRFSSEQSIRTKVYQWDTLKDIWDTTLLGNGVRGAWTETSGVPPHNAFLHMHLALGGITAWPYATMLIVLAIRAKRLVFSREVPLDVRLWVLAVFGMAFVDQMMSTWGFVEIQSILAMAIVDRFTAPYSRRGIAQRKVMQQEQALTMAWGTTWPSPAYR